MKKLVLAGALFLGVVSYGQNRVNIDVERGQKVDQYILDSVKFINKDFMPGVVVFKDGTMSRGALNITTLEQAVLFISPEGEIQQLVNMQDVARVSIGRRMFVRNRNAFIEIVELAGDIALGIMRMTSILGVEAKGAYGMVSETTAISTVTAISENGRMLSLGKNLTMPVSYKEVPYLYRNDTFYPASRKSFIKCFSSKKSEIEKYLKQNKVDFDEYDDVKALFDAVK